MLKFIVSVILAINLMETMAEDPKGSNVFDKQMEEYKAECLKEYKISEEEDSVMKEGKPPTTEAGKCFVGCMFEKMAIIKDGKYDVEKAKEIANEQLSNEKANLEIVIQALENCNKKVKTTEKCQTGPAIMECLMEKYTELKKAQKS